jgi:dihydrofolate synthase/folylpolyglutamate synthase
VVLDGAHNPDAAAALAGSLPEVIDARPLVGVVAILDDKDAAGILSALLPRMTAVLFPRIANPRALPPPTLASLAAQLADVPARVVADPRDALEQARALAGREGAVLATGSLHLVADLVREDRSTRASML